MKNGIDFEFFSTVPYNSFDNCTKPTVSFHTALLIFKTHREKLKIPQARGTNTCFYDFSLRGQQDYYSEGWLDQRRWAQRLMEGKASLLFLAQCLRIWIPKNSASEKYFSFSSEAEWHKPPPSERLLWLFSCPWAESIILLCSYLRKKRNDIHGAGKVGRVGEWWGNGMGCEYHKNMIIITSYEF